MLPAAVFWEEFIDSGNRLMLLQWGLVFCILENIHDLMLAIDLLEKLTSVC